MTDKEYRERMDIIMEELSTLFSDPNCTGVSDVELVQEAIDEIKILRQKINNKE